MGHAPESQFSGGERGPYGPVLAAFAGGGAALGAAAVGLLTWGLSAEGGLSVGARLANAGGGLGVGAVVGGALGGVVSLPVLLAMGAARAAGRRGSRAPNGDARDDAGR